MKVKLNELKTILRHSRLNAGDSQTELAEKLGLKGKTYISDLETGRRPITLKTLRLIEKVYNIKFEINLLEQ